MVRCKLCERSYRRYDRKIDPGLSSLWLKKSKLLDSLASAE